MISDLKSHLRDRYCVAVNGNPIREQQENDNNEWKDEEAANMALDEKMNITMTEEKFIAEFKSYLEQALTVKLS